MPKRAKYLAKLAGFKDKELIKVVPVYGVDEATLEREMRHLRSIKDSYPKYLLTMDDDPLWIDQGIRKINVLDWLAEG